MPERPVPTLQPAAEPGVGGAFAADASLHARLRAQLDALGSGRSANPAATLNALLPVISKQYESMDEERRSVVRSMQLMADEARGFAQGLTGSDAGQLRAILDHIKDVVITATDDGAIQLFNPTGEQLFGYSQAELVGVSIVRLLPELQVQGSLVRGLQAYADQSAAGGQREPRITQARRSDGALFPVELVTSQVQIGRQNMFVICLRDRSERLAAEQALRDSEARYRTLVESAPEMIVVIDSQSGRCTDANENALDFFAVKRTELGTLKLRELLQVAERLAPDRAPCRQRDLATGTAHLCLALSPP